LPIQLTATADSGLDISYSSSIDSICSVSHSLLFMRGVGKCSITASQPGNDVYAAASPVSRTFNISAGSQTLRFGAVLNPTVGLPPFEVPVQASSFLPVSVTSLTPAVCRAAATLVTSLAEGTCTLQASQPGNANYNPAPTLQSSFNIRVAAPSGYLKPAAGG